VISYTSLLASTVEARSTVKPIWRDGIGVPFFLGFLIRGTRPDRLIFPRVLRVRLGGRITSGHDGRESGERAAPGAGASGGPTHPRITSGDLCRSPLPMKGGALIAGLSLFCSVRAIPRDRSANRGGGARLAAERVAAPSATLRAALLPRKRERSSTAASVQVVRWVPGSSPGDDGTGESGLAEPAGRRGSRRAQ
jgi:hypothetical protein